MTVFYQSNFKMIKKKMKVMQSMCLFRSRYMHIIFKYFVVAMRAAVFI